MKASELRIGNLVYEIINNYNEEVVKITSLSDMFIGWSPYRNTGHHNHIKPIPLTEEWLLKFRFKEVKRYTHDYEEKIYSKSIIVGSENHCETLTISMPFKVGFIGDYFSDECYTLNIDINNVHQLQNLYFALTGEELTV
jgi:hypothetical protein